MMPRILTLLPSSTIRVTSSVTRNRLASKSPGIASRRSAILLHTDSIDSGSDSLALSFWTSPGSVDTS
jgi:hypothetical protein